MMKMITLLCLIFTGLTYDQPPKKTQPPTLNVSAGAQKPVLDERNKTYNIIIYGTYTKVSDKTWMKVYVRESKKDDEKNVQTNLWGPESLKAAEMPGESHEIIRDPKEPKSGQFLGIVQCPVEKYRPTTHRYEFKIEFYEGEKLLGVHRKDDKEWVPVEIKE